MQQAIKIKAMVANVRKGLDAIFNAAPQLRKPQRWNTFVRHIIESILTAKPNNIPPPP